MKVNKELSSEIVSIGVIPPVFSDRTAAFVKGRVVSERNNICLDSGCSFNMISEQSVDDHDCFSVQTIRDKVEMKAAFGSIIVSKEVTRTEVSIAGEIKEVEFRIVDNLPCDCVAFLNFKDELLLLRDGKKRIKLRWFDYSTLKGNSRNYGKLKAIAA